MRVGLIGDCLYGEKVNLPFRINLSVTAMNAAIEKLWENKEVPNRLEVAPSEEKVAYAVVQSLGLTTEIFFNNDIGTEGWLLIGEDDE